MLFLFFFCFSLSKFIMGCALVSLYTLFTCACFLPKMFWKVLLHVSDLFLSLSGLPEKGIIIRVGIQQFLRVLGWPLAACQRVEEILEAICNADDERRKKLHEKKKKKENNFAIALLLVAAHVLHIQLECTAGGIDTFLFPSPVWRW